MQHWRAYCELNVLPQAQWLGIRFNLQPYLIDSRSQKLCLFRLYPSSLIGRVVSRKDAPVSRFRSFCFLSSELISFLMVSRIFFCRSFFTDFICVFLLLNSGPGSYLLNWSVMQLQKTLMSWWNFDILFCIILQILVHPILGVGVLKMTAFSHFQ